MQLSVWIWLFHLRMQLLHITCANFIVVWEIPDETQTYIIFWLSDIVLRLTKYLQVLDNRSLSKYVMPCQMQKYPEIFMNRNTSPIQPTLSQNVTFADTLLSMTLPTSQLPLVVLSGSLQFLLLSVVCMCWRKDAYLCVCFPFITYIIYNPFYASIFLNFHGMFLFMF